jgi:hypothetical protein
MARCLELPDDVLQIIREYAQPLTRPDWRTLHLMPHDKYLLAYINEYHDRIMYILHHPDWNNLERRAVLCRYKRVFYRRFVKIES